VPANGVVEPLNEVERIGTGIVARPVFLPLIRSVLREEKKLSIAALSQTLPERLIEQMTPLSVMSFWICSPAYWADSTGRRNTKRLEVVTMVGQRACAKLVTASGVAMSLIPAL